MQLMVADSEEGEFGKTDLTQSLKLIPGRVKRMQVGSLRLPHMGWNRVISKYENPLFAGIPNGEHFYFVHSYAVDDYEHTLATCHYASAKNVSNAVTNECDAHHKNIVAEQLKADIGATFSAAIHKDNFFGVQFHPERSSDAGAQLLKNFIQL
jgi:glutamine amidotransferase